MPTDLRTPIDDYLERQQDLSAVDRFAAHHDRDTGPLQERWYRQLLPAAPPGPGQQYRFEVDMDRCTSCKSCVSACHSLNGLDAGESWRSAGVVVGVGWSGPTQQTVTTACHHCVDPACLAGCPVDAYEKDPITGIVRHLDDQCIGCSYCTWTCPYEVPRFNERLGIVRKCDMCSDRLAVGEAPACVQACPTGAIAIGVVDVAELVAGTDASSSLVPGAPSSALTVPTTRYHRADALPDTATAADDWSEAPAHAHLPLVAMLVLTQLSVGTFVAVAALAALAPGLPDRVLEVGALAAAGAGLLAIGASVGHLGRPLQAWRAVLGIGHSWLSREIAAFGLFAPAAVAAAAARLAEPRSPLAHALGAGVSVVGVGAVACSAMIYAVTGRRAWRLDRTATAFTATASTCGLSTAAVVLLAPPQPATGSGALQVVSLLLAVTTAAVLGIEGRPLLAGHAGDPVLDRTVRLLRGPLAPTVRARIALLASGGVAVPLLLVALLAEPHPPVAAMRALSVVGLVLVVRGELAGRTLFFRSMTSPRMPGIPR
ncbi:MAG TPA: DmsC/YnfH family molybdoenzyme membrane anchor subunit [Acidimicrobiales bacterium]|nr:DmsC/YnfH family molybdoenzyme membrane anchor subunit [Acidimicrobiales bacterium]